MKSVKPGRGPSKLNAVGSIFAALFGVFWCIVAAFGGAWIMLPFGLLFIGYSIYQAVYHLHNMKSEDRYSVVDLVDSEEESDPFNKKYGRQAERENSAPSDHGSYSDAAYCPYCGRSVDRTFSFCPGCGKKLSD